MLKLFPVKGITNEDIISKPVKIVLFFCLYLVILYNFYIQKTQRRKML